MQLFDEKVLNKIGERLMARKETIAVAESVTSGMLQLAISSITDASQFYQGGLTAYNLAQKCRHLDVEPIHAASVNSVSQKVANEMANRVCVHFASHWGIGITGYASPTPESGQKLYAYYAICLNGKIKAYKKLTATNGEPVRIQLKYVNEILNRLKQLL